ncbi:MAG TPA: hypothetical protein VEJ39_00200, partial [Candidatus Acidoferrales bacterium]|nr:hypothetical protein [Candidatus Acidoferrales bacterium]
GFREVAQRKTHTRQSYLPKSWKSTRETSPNIVSEVTRNVSDVINEIQADDLDVPTFLRRQAQKA